VPLYDYDCSACGLRFEVMHGVHVDGPSACPACGSDRVRKAFAAPAVHFKGSGWAKKERRATATPGAGKPASSDGQGGTEGPSGGGSGGSADGGGDSSGSGSGDTSSSKDRSGASSKDAASTKSTSAATGASAD
jgi:putative FmdB family regulatory protein